MNTSLGPTDAGRIDSGNHGAGPDLPLPTGGLRFGAEIVTTLNGLCVIRHGDHVLTNLGIDCTLEWRPSSEWGEEGFTWDNSSSLSALAAAPPPPGWSAPEVRIGNENFNRPVTAEGGVPIPGRPMVTISNASDVPPPRATAPQSVEQRIADLERRVEALEYRASMKGHTR